MTFSEHLEELRSRLIIALVAFGVAFLVAFAFQERLLRFFSRPYRIAVTSINQGLRDDWAKKSHEAKPSEPDRLDLLIDELERTGKALTKEQVEKLRGTRKAAAPTEPQQLPLELQGVAISEPFSAYMQVCMLAAGLVSAPILLLQLWKFIAAGLYDHEKKTVTRVLPWSLVLFFLGLAFGFFVLAELSVQFLVSYGDLEVVRPQVTVGSYLSLLLLLLLIMGLVFQIPLIMTILASVGLVTPKWFRSKRRHCILAIFVIAAIITPPDYISQLIVAGPMLILFELGIFLAAGASKRRELRLTANESGEHQESEGGGGNPPRNPKT